MAFKLLISLTALSLMLLDIAHAVTECPENEVSVDCLPGCNDSCTNYNQPCAVRVKCPNKGCVCKEYYARNDAGICVPWIDCPNAKCGKNEVKTLFSGPPSCTPSCEDPTAGQLCRFIPIPGCVCRENYIRRRPEGKCVPQNCCEKFTGNKVGQTDA